MESGYSEFFRSIALHNITAAEEMALDASVRVEGEVLRQEGNLMLVKGTGIFGEEYSIVAGGRCAAHYLNLKVAEKHFDAAISNRSTGLAKEIGV